MASHREQRVWPAGRKKGGMSIIAGLVLELLLSRLELPLDVIVTQ